MPPANHPCCSSFTPCGTRTRNLRIRSPTPCPSCQGGHASYDDLPINHELLDTRRGWTPHQDGSGSCSCPEVVVEWWHPWVQQAIVSAAHAQVLSRLQAMCCHPKADASLATRMNNYAWSTWCSGITSASHAEGPGFKSQCVHIIVMRRNSLAFHG